MSARELFAFNNRYFSAGVGVAAGLFVLSALGGFILLPYAQPELKFAGLWEAICSAAGLPQRSAPVAALAPAHRLSEVVLTPTTLAYPSRESIGRGATLAQRCAICHGARTNAVMSPFALTLSDQDVADVAAYYAYLPRLPAYHPERQLPKPRIVIYGAPLRGIAPCGSCHGSLDNKAGSPWLEGQSEAYMKAQLQALASGQRSNDISQQMRNIARAMTPQEIGEAAAYYASQPPEVVKATD